MGILFYIMGKSASGKDSIYQKLQKKEELKLNSLVLYTTRPIRENETDGVEYHFVTEEKLEELEKAGKVIELRVYDTVQGIWKYFTADDGKMDLSEGNCLGIGTLVSYEKLKAYYGKEKVVPIYVEVADDIRLERAIARERKQERPDYQEMCRRFLADSEDFSEENLKRAEIKRRFQNNGAMEACVEEIVQFMKEHGRKSGS